MRDLGTLTAADGQEVARSPGATRQVRPRRTLPGGRAVVGGFLVAAAAVGIFAAYATATAPPSTAYAVAARDVAVGSMLSGREFRFVPLDLPPALRSRAVPEELRDQLSGLQTLGPLTAGDLLLESNVVRAGGERPTEQISIPLASSRAMMGQLRAGEVVDIVATYGTGGADSFTAYAARGVQVVAIEGGGSTIGQDIKVFTVALERPEDVLSVAHAVNTAEVFLVRTPGGGDGDAPPPYRPSRAG